MDREWEFLNTGWIKGYVMSGIFDDSGNFFNPIITAASLIEMKMLCGFSVYFKYLKENPRNNYYFDRVKS